MTNVSRAEFYSVSLSLLLLLLPSTWVAPEEHNLGLYPIESGIEVDANITPGFRNAAQVG
jgi:hypothetical protein